MAGMMKGTTGTGLDALVDLITTDPGLNLRISTTQINQGAYAANAMNKLIVEAIKATGVANDGKITASDMYLINKYIRNNDLAAWTKWHGDDEGTRETDFHLVQGDGGFTRLFAENAIDTIADGLYHVGFRIEDGRFVNEDGDGNASLEETAFWLNELLAGDLKSGELKNPAVRPYASGTTGTGLDQLVTIATQDAGLNHEISTAQIAAGGRAANAMNKIIVEAIKATGAADDGEISDMDVYDLNAYIRKFHLKEWTALHGDDENGVETGFHLIQGDGAVTQLFGENAINTVGDGLYHLGFKIEWDRFLNEDGNGNASVDSVADWLNLLLKDDIKSGELSSGRPDVDPTTLTDDIAYKLNQNLDVRDGAGYLELGKTPAIALAQGTFALNFTARTPGKDEYQTLFAKDGDGQKAGDIAAFIRDGELYVRLQSNGGEVWLSSGGFKIEAGVNYDMAFSFGPKGASLWLNGVEVDSEIGFTANLLLNTKSLIVGASNWYRTASNPGGLWDHFEGRINDFTVYDHALSEKEIKAITQAGPLPGDGLLLPANGGAQPAVLEGTGLRGYTYNSSRAIDSIEDLQSLIYHAKGATHVLDVAEVNFGENKMAATVGGFLGKAAEIKSGSGAVAMETIGMELKGYIYIPAGTHRITVKSDDGFLLDIGGEYFSSYEYGRGFEATGRTADFKGGLYAIDLLYFENGGGQGLRLEIDGKLVGAESFFRTIADYKDALAEHGPMPDGGLPGLDDAPRGTTGTGLDKLIGLIANDQGLADNLTSSEILRGAAAANAMNKMIVDAIVATGAALDGKISTADVYDIAARIRAKDLKEWTIAHGDDEGNSETGFHLIQGDGSATRLYGENAINTVLDGLYHMGFKVIDGRFVNEDGDANARLETVAYWLNEILGLGSREDLMKSGLPFMVGSASYQDVTLGMGVNAILAPGARNITLTGTAENATGNYHDNVMTGNGVSNILDGRIGQDTISGGEGSDRLTGGEGGDRLSGDAGKDVLIGGMGFDHLEGGDGADKFILDSISTSGDWIKDFDKAEGDKICISSGGFGGKLPANGQAWNKIFVANDTGFADASQRFWFDTASNQLWFDADGVGSGSAARMIADLTGMTGTLTAADILFFA
jgi:Ca2+-binding RTX toxin-like protein